MFAVSLISLSWLSAVLSVLAIYWRRSARAKCSRLPLPPGPVALPIIGNAHQTPKEYSWLHYTEWSRKYGHIFYFRLFREHVIVLNTYQAAVDLFEKRSNQYSSRPNTFIMAGDLVGWKDGVTLRPSGPLHAKCRRLLAGTLSRTASRELWPLQESGARRFLKLVLEDPQHFFTHIRTTVSETIVMVAFGQECSKEGFPYIEMAESTHETFNVAASPYAYAVDYFPLLRFLPEWFPGASFKKQARLWNEELHELVYYPYEIVKNDMKNGKARPSYVAKHIDKPQDQKEVMWSAASLYTGGVDTTTASVRIFFLAMLLYPQVQAKAQAELDHVVGTERLPEISDRESLPYVNACIQELMRWSPVGPLGVAHCASQADEYEGYQIPKGATVISNIWAMTHDPNVYLDPDEFRPERFLPSSGGEALRNDRSAMAFGFGRRICPGRHTAETSLFIYMACTLATFNISKTIDVDGHPIEPELKWVSGLITEPKPFECTMTLRSQTASRLIRD